MLNKRILVTFLLLFVLSASVLAKEEVHQSCTSNEKVVQIKVDLDDAKASEAVKVNIQKAFDQAAHQLDSDTLATYIGYAVFTGGLSEASKAAINNVSRPTVVDGTCKVK